MRLILALAALLVAAPAAAQVAPAQLESAPYALARDAATYARVSGLSADDAARQLRAQAGTVPVTDALSTEFAVRLAGIAIEHHPYRIAVLLTGADPVAERQVIAGDLTVPIVFTTGAPVTHAALVAALSEHQAAIRARLPHPPGLGVDPRTGSLQVLLGAADAAGFAPGALAAELAALTGVPVTLRVLDRTEANSAADGPVEGGGHIDGISPVDGRRYACTAGFTVTDGTRFGLVTAAHCPDTLSYVDADRHRVPLEFVGQWGWSFQDVQLNLADAEVPLEPLFYADTARTLLRPVTGTRPRASTRVGDVVCHRGERTGYSCGEVELIDFAPAGDLCGGACAPTWVAVSGPGCRSGDSGGPVFDGTVALGIVKGASYRPDGSCGFYYYMSLDYLPQGWSVLRAPPVMPAPPVTPAPSRPGPSRPGRSAGIHRRPGADTLRLSEAPGRTWTPAQDRGDDHHSASRPSFAAAISNANSTSGSGALTSRAISAGAIARSRWRITATRALLLLSARTQTQGASGVCVRASIASRAAE